MKKLNIIQTINNLSNSSGGPTKTVLSLSKYLNEQTNLKLVSNKIQFSNSSYLKNFNQIDIKYNQPKFIYNPLFDVALEKLISSFKLDSRNTVFHDNGLWLPFNNTISKICKKQSIPQVISSHGMLEPWSLNYRFFKKKFAWLTYQKENLKRVNVIHATSFMEAENISKLNLKVPIAIIPNGIDKPIKKKLPKKFDQTSLGLEKNDKRKIMLYLGRIHPKKGLLNFLKAWKNSSTLLNDWRFVIAGFPEENYLKNLKEFVNNNNINHSVYFLDPLFEENLANIYKYSKIFVLPTFSENFGLVIAEALSYGLPTITTKGTPWSSLEKGNAGWWCESSIEDFEKVLKLSTTLTEKEYKIMSQNAYELSKFYNWDQISKSFLELYDWVLQKKNKPSFVID